MEADSCENEKVAGNYQRKNRRSRRKQKNGHTDSPIVDLGEELPRWIELKTALQLSDEELAKLLIDRYTEEENNSEKTELHRQQKRESKRYENKSTVYNLNNFNLSDYGVYFPQPDFGDEIIPEEISAVENVLNLNYGNDVESGHHAQHKHMTSPIPIHVTDPCAVARENAFLVYNSCLIQLANQNPPKDCTVKNCKGDVSMVKKNSGTSINFIWTCSKGHIIREWCSQPLLQGQGHLGDLLLAAGIEMSGSNYNQVALMLKIMNVECLSSQSYDYLKTNFVTPKIISYWMREQTDILSVLDGRDVMLLGSGLQDKKEQLASFCTFSILDYESSEVLYISVVEKKESDSQTHTEKLELLAFTKALHMIQKAGARVVEVVTNIEPRINSYLKKKHPDIKRSFDMWEGAKMVGKSIVEASSKEGCGEIITWLPDIVDHFLDCSNRCADMSGTLWASTDEEAFLDSFVTGIIHHTMNNHQWISGECSHPPLPHDSKQWLVPDSPAHNQLKQTLLNKPLSSILSNFSTNRTTSGLECLMDYITIYTPDNHKYSFTEYKARVYLAVLDYMNHQNRANELDDSGKEIPCRIFSNYTGSLLTQPKKEAKQYNYIPVIVEKIIGSALNSD
ncbi:uncharacterized protein LOC126827376 [Patella vulgata]|uniref:uncharacterized protein LOC126827376 n=1 Tax=Patella vulgata TaxID=6465 RepID=UPI00217F70CF|nr:uncharacterized protein LOC126827376 [Patella vulgata]